MTSESPVKLTKKQQSFAQACADDVDPVKALQLAGYQTKNPKIVSAELLRNSRIQFEIERLKAEAALGPDINEAYVLRTIKAVIERNEGENDQAVLKACELLGKYLAMFTEKHSHEVVAPVSSIKITVVEAK